MKTVSVHAVIVMLFIALLLAVLPEFLPATDVSTPRTAHAESMITPCADVIEWRYKVINGRLHRRQYNTSTHRWIGEWEPC